MIMTSPWKSPIGNMNNQPSLINQNLMIVHLCPPFRRCHGGVGGNDKIVECHAQHAGKTTIEKCGVVQSVEGFQRVVARWQPNEDTGEPIHHKLKHHNGFACAEPLLRFRIDGELVLPRKIADSCRKQQRKPNDVESPHVRILDCHRHRKGENCGVVENANQKERLQRELWTQEAGTGVQEAKGAIPQTVVHVVADFTADTTQETELADLTHACPTPSKDGEHQQSGNNMGDAHRDDPGERPSR